MKTHNRKRIKTIKLTVVNRPTEFKVIPLTCQKVKNLIETSNRRHLKR